MPKMKSFTRFDSLIQFCPTLIAVIARLVSMMTNSQC